MGAAKTPIFDSGDDQRDYRDKNKKWQVRFLFLFPIVLMQGNMVF